MNNDGIWKSLNSVWTLESQVINDLKTDVNRDLITKIVHDIAARKGRLFTTGAGTSAAAAKKIAHTFCCIGVPCGFLVPSDAVHGGLGILQENDLVIAISKGGNTKEITQLIPGIKRKNGKIIAVTEDENSTLGQAGDYTLKIKVSREACPFNMLATSSTLAVIAIFDAIASTLITYTNYTKEDFAVIHPSGAVGERLKSNLTEGETRER